jgi:hypothetical protein
MILQTTPLCNDTYCPSESVRCVHIASGEVRNSPPLPYAGIVERETERAMTLARESIHGDPSFCRADLFMREN